MAKKAAEEFNTEEVNDRPLLKVIEGGKPPVDPNWLRQLEPGSVFVCRPRNLNKTIHTLDQYHVTYHGGRSTLLYHNLNGMINEEPVDNMRFSVNMELIEVIGNSNPNKQEENDGSGNLRPREPVPNG